jgi:hypothetical protein
VKKEIQRRTKRVFSPEEKIRIVLEGLGAKIASHQSAERITFMPTPISHGARSL